MGTITQTITELPAVPNPGSSTFASDMRAFHTAEAALEEELNAFGEQANSLRADCNSAKEDAESAKADAESAEAAAVAAAGFKGAWSSTTTYSSDESVRYDSKLWRSLQDNNLNNIPVEGSWWTRLDDYYTQNEVDNLIAGVKTTTVAKTADYTLTASDCNGLKTFTNSGAAGEVIFTLPTGATDLTCNFLVVAGQYLRVKASNDEVIAYLGESTAANGYVRSSYEGSAWTVLWNGTKWVVVKMNRVLLYDE